VKVHRLVGEVEAAGGRLPAFLDGVRCVLRHDGAFEAAFRPSVDVALPELLAVPGFTGTWDVEGGVLVAGRVPYLVDRPPTLSICLVMAAKLAGLGLDETARLLDLQDRVLGGVALDLRGWEVRHPEVVAEECGLLEAWRHCVAQFTPSPESSPAASR
jgi:hypothetical protein